MLFGENRIFLYRVANNTITTYIDAIRADTLDGTEIEQPCTIYVRQLHTKVCFRFGQFQAVTDGKLY